MKEKRPPLKKKIDAKKKIVSKPVSELVDFQRLFESVQGLYLVLLPDENFTIVAVSDNYTKATLTKREEITGKGIFDVFPDNPNDTTADGVSNLRSSLNYVLKNKRKHAMAVQKYDIQKPAKDGGGWEVKYWDPINTPVLDKDGKIIYIIHCVKDITEGIEAKEREATQIKRNKALEASEKEYVQKLIESEERFRLLTQSVKDYAIFMIDKKGIVISWNKGAERIKGYKENEIIGKSASIFYLDKEREEGVLLKNLKTALEEGSCEVEGWRIRKDRSVFWANVIYTPVFDDDGKHTGFSKITRDLTARKKFEEEIKRSNEFLDSVLENIPNMVFVKDARTLKFVRFNRSGEELLGLSRKELIGKSDHDFFPEEQANKFILKDKEVLQGNKVFDIAEEVITTKEGQRWLHTRKIPIKDAAGMPLYLLGISEDITEKRVVDEQIKQLNYDLTRSVGEMELANKELESFSYSVSHDLRAPLRAIRGYTKILMEDYAANLAEDAQKMMGSVASNAERMSQLIDDLLAFSRMGKKEMNITTTDMNIVAKSALKTVQFANGNQLKAKVKINNLMPAMADSSLIENVFTNLIGNAVKYSGKIEDPVIVIDSYKNDNETVYSIKDNGVGFDMKYYNKLFGVFQRLHSTTEFEGTGVGLALVKRIITRHGGRVWAEAEPGNGATFYIALQPVN